MKRALFLLIFILSGALQAERLSVPVSAQAAILINAETGAVLYEKNAGVPLYPASITKVATALYMLKVQGENLEPLVAAEHDSVASISEEAKKRANYTLPSHWLETGASHIGIKRGERLSLNDLLHGMMVASGNDAANVIARYIGGTVSGFMEELNHYLKELGCKNTYFCNPHGLHHPKHVTTAYDMAFISQEALKNPLFRNVVKTVRYTRPKTNKQKPATLVQTNRLLRKGKHYDARAIGVKTGYTSDADNTLVAAATHEGRTLIAVLMKAKERDAIIQDAKRLFDAAFSQTRVQRILLKKGPQRYALNLAGARGPVRTYITTNVCTNYYPAEEPDFNCRLYWDKNLSLPIEKEQRLGEIHLMTEEGRVLQAVPVFALHAMRSSWTNWFKGLFTNGEKVPEELPQKSGGGRFWKAGALFLAFLFLFAFFFLIRKK